VSDDQTREDLRKLAAVYIARAARIESKDKEYALGRNQFAESDTGHKTALSRLAPGWAAFRFGEGLRGRSRPSATLAANFYENNQSR
jgi:hypothetical protein